MPVINKGGGLKSWAQKPKAKPVAWSDDDAQRFYNSPAWRKCRKSYMDAHPLCEVSLSRNEHRPGRDCDHIIPIRFGGARFHPHNLVSLTVSLHRRKSAMEARRNQPLVAWTETEHGLVPKNRDELFALLLLRR